MVKISVNNLEFSYNGTPTLKNIHFDIGRGDFVSIVGPNGSGKSTLLKCLNGILKPQKGIVYISGQNIKHLSLRSIAQEIAYVPQNNPQTLANSVFDTILLGRKPYINWKPETNDFEVTSKTITQLNLNSIAFKDINKLSGGQQQTVYIGRALAQQPEILLLDEPTASLDLKHTVETMDILMNLCTKGITVVAGLHDINLALRYSNKIIMIREGKIFACGGKEIITEENLENLYNIRVKVFENNDSRFVVPIGLLNN